MEPKSATARPTRETLQARAYQPWIRVSLPELAILSLEAYATRRGTGPSLACEAMEEVELETGPGLRFRVYPLIGDDRTFLLAEAPLASPPSLGPRIRTTLGLDGRLLAIELDLVPRDRRPWSLELRPLDLGLEAPGPRPHSGLAWAPMARAPAALTPGPAHSMDSLAAAGSSIQGPSVAWVAAPVSRSSKATARRK